MRAFFRIVMKVFAAAMSALRWVRDETGRLVMKLGGGGMPMAPMPEYEEVLEDRGVAPDRGYDQLRSAADALHRGGVPSPETLAAIGEDNVKWLSAMPTSMLMLVIGATDEQLSAHMRQVRSIRGLLAYDRESIAAYVEVIERDRELKPKGEQRRRTTNEWLDAYA